MLKQRVWAIEIRPYYLDNGAYVSIMPPKRMMTVSSTGGNVDFRGFGEGKIVLECDNGPWIEWSRSNSFQEVREKCKDAIEKFGKDKVRIVEIHNIEMITLPNA